MIRTIRLALARHAHIRAVRNARSYMRQPYGEWDIRVQVALDRVECAAANRLALMIQPRAW